MEPTMKDLMLKKIADMVKITRPDTEDEPVPPIPSGVPEENLPTNNMAALIKRNIAYHNKVGDGGDGYDKED